MFHLNNVIENVVRRHELTNTGRANERVENKYLTFNCT